MADQDAQTTTQATETMNAVESAHINPDTSRRKGRKRSANGDIDHRSERKRRLSGEGPETTDYTDTAGLTRTASEEIMDRPNTNAGADDAETNDEDNAGDKSVNGHAEPVMLPKPDEITPLAPYGLDEDGQPLSKNQMKKRRKQAEWDAKADDRKAIRKEKLVAKRERKRAAREGQPALPPQPKRPRVQLPVTFLIDCDFDDLMLDKERKSLASQVTRSYSDTSKSPFYPHLAVCSFGGKLRERFDNILTHYKRWKGIRFLDEEFVAAAEQAKQWMTDPARHNKLAGSFSPFATEEENSDGLNALQDEGEIVYLTSESEYTLTALKPYSTYIIGGLVDKNREKGVCFQRATERGIKTAKLPIGEFLEMASRKVLATNHVNEIMLKWLECGDWGEAFMQVIPKRKGGRLRGDGGKEGDGEAEDDEDAVDEDMNGNEIDEEPPREGLADSKAGLEQKYEESRGHDGGKVGDDFEALREPVANDEAGNTARNIASMQA